MRGEPYGGWIEKGRPAALDREDRKAAWQKRDKAESVKVKARSKGRCEVEVKGVRCKRRAFQVHHHLGGFGVRGRGDSALAKNKTHTCNTCHPLITANVLVHLRGNRYRRLE